MSRISLFNRFSHSLSSFLPDHLPRLTLYSSFLVAFLGMVLFDQRYASFTFPPPYRSQFLDSATYLLDPLIIHGISLVLLVSLSTSYLHLHLPTGSPFAILAVSVAVPVFLIAASFLLERAVLKPAFRYPRPGLDALPLGDPWLTAVVSKALGPSTESASYQDVPSGFALRQLTLFFATQWVISQRTRGKPWLPFATRATVFILNLGLLAFVMFSRLYRANHSLFAMSVAIGVATSLFWSFVAVLYALSPTHRDRYRHLLTENFTVYFAFALFFFYFSNDAGRWLVLSVIILAILALAYILPARLDKPKGRT